MYVCMYVLCMYVLCMYVCMYVCMNCLSVFDHFVGLVLKGLKDFNNYSFIQKFKITRS